MRTPVRRLVVVALAPALLLGACGGGGGDRRAQEGAEKAEAVASTVTTEAPTTSTTAPAPTTTTSPVPPTTAKPAVAPKPTTATTVPAARDSETGGAPLDLTGYTVVGPAPTDDAGLDAFAARLVADERALRADGATAESVTTAAVSAQSAYRSLATNPEVLPRVLSRVPAELQAAVKANTDAGALLRSMTKPRTGLPPWHIVAPPPAAELEGYYREAEGRTGVPWAYLAAVHLVETRMGRIRGVSTAGAQGPMQFMPATWEAYGEGDINNPRDAILAAARYLQRNGAPGDMRKALWNYNHNYKYVDAVTTYAKQVEADHRAYAAYWNWQVFYITVEGDVLLPVGYVGS